MEKTIIRFAVLAVGSMVAGLLLLHVFPIVYGWVTGNIIGLLFGNYLAQHDTVYHLVRNGLVGSYTLCVVAGLDFLFVFTVYLLLDSFVTKQGSLRDIAVVSLRAGAYLLLMQAAVGAVIGLALYVVPSFSVVWLVPPFLSAGLLDSIYMVLWELTLFFFALGFALREKWLPGVVTGGQLFLRHWKLGLIVITVGILITWLPGFILSAASLPGVGWTMLGLVFHVLFISLVSIFWFTQPDTFTDAE